MQPNATAVDDLAVFPFLTTKQISTIPKVQLPLYLTKAADNDSSIDALSGGRFGLSITKGAIDTTLFGCI